MGAEVPEGQHFLEFIFKPSIVWIGGALSITTLIAVLIAVFAITVRDRRRYI